MIFEIIVEFWSQRFFYLGLIISITTFIGCLLYLIWTWIMKQRNNT